MAATPAVPAKGSHFARSRIVANGLGVRFGLSVLSRASGCRFWLLPSPGRPGYQQMPGLAGRSEVRDFLDVVYLHESYLSLGGMCWAACGKDQGFTPWSLLDHAKRHMRFRDEDLAAENLVKPTSLVQLKEGWLKAAEQAEQLFSRLLAAEVGCLYLDPNYQPCTPEPSDPDYQKMTRHFGSIRGAWPLHEGESGADGTAE